MLWPTLAMMAFSTVWGFGNVVNGYVYFDGTKVVFSWVLMFLLYFVPYALMVGELGATFKMQMVVSHLGLMRPWVQNGHIMPDGPIGLVTSFIFPVKVPAA